MLLRGKRVLTDGFFGEVRGVENLKRLIGQELGLALNRGLSGEVSEGDKVLGVDCNTTAIGLCLIEVLVDALVVVVEKSAILHELDRTLEDSRTTLRVLIHHSNLDVLGEVAHGDSRVDGVVVIVDLHLGVEGEVRA